MSSFLKVFQFKFNRLSTPNNYLIWVFTHTILLLVFFEVLRVLGVIDVSLLEIGYQKDSLWYWSIIAEGYSYLPNQKSNVAYYPLFAWFWELSHLEPPGISIVNWLITLFSIYLVGRELKIPMGHLAIFLSFPSVIFCMVPYSEALFFLGGALILTGLQWSRLVIVVIGIVLACTTRSIGIILALCFLFSYIIRLNGSFTRLDHLKSVLPVLISLTVNWMVQLYQFDQVGIPFNYIDVQAQWGRVLALPGLPLTARPFPSTAWADYLALFVGIVSGVFLLKLGFNKVSNIRTDISKGAMFSMFYLAGVTCVVVLFSRKDGDGSTVIASLNRFVFATPYFLVFLNEMLIQSRKLVKRDLLLLILTGLVFEWLLLTFGVGTVKHHLNWQVYFLITLSVPLVYVALLIRPQHRWWIVIYLVGTLVQAYFLGLFIAESWVG